MGGKTKMLFLSPKLNHLVSTMVKMNPKLVIMILSVFVVWE